MPATAPRSRPLPKKAQKVSDVVVTKTVKVVESDKRIQVNENLHEVLVDGNVILLAPKEFKILALLKLNAGKTVSRNEILSSVWGNEGRKFNERTVDQHVARMRKKISHAGVYGGDVVKTQNSFGYTYKEV